MKKGFAQINLAVFLGGFTAILGKAISLSAPVLVWYCMGLAVLILFVLIAYRRVKRLAVIGPLFALHWMAFYGSVKLANASIAVVCLASASVFTALVDSLLNKGRVNRLELVLSLLALLGVACIDVFHAEPPRGTTPAMPHFSLGLLLGLVAALISSLFSVLSELPNH